MKKEFDLKIEGGTLQSIKIDSSNSLIVATYKRDVEEFKAGDILIDDLGTASTGDISIFKCINEENDNLFDIYAVFNAEYNGIIDIGESENAWDYIEDQRLATEQEKQLLFDALKKEGLKWNAEKLELERLAPEFKAGDILVDDLDPFSDGAISIFKGISSRNDGRGLFDIYVVVDANRDGVVEFNHIEWDFITNQRLATEEEKQLLFDALKKQGKRWNAETLEIEELDISEIIIDYESAIKYLGIKDTLLVFKNYDRANKFNNQIKLQIIAEAWNKFDGFEADWENDDQHKHYPIFEVKDGKFEFSGTSFFRAFLDFHTSNLSFKTRERAKQFGEQFINLFKIAFGF